MKYLLEPIFKLISILCRLFIVVISIIFFVLFLIVVTICEILWYFSIKNLFIYKVDKEMLSTFKDVPAWLNGEDLVNYDSITDFILNNPK